MVLSFPLATPALLLAAAVPSLATGETDIMRIIIGLGLGVPALLVLVLSTWTCNAANLYSAGLGLATTVRSVPRWKLTILAGAAGALLAVAGIIDAFVPFLLLLGIIVPPVAAIYVVEGFTLFRHGYDPVALADGPAVRWPSVVTWAVAAGIALMTAREWFTLSGVPALDAALAAGLLHWLMVRRVSPAVPAVADASTR
jgi:cytosine permease